MPPTVRNEIFDLPHALGEILEQGRREYDLVIRNTRWGDLPKTFAGAEELLSVTEFTASAFAELLEWSCAVQSCAAAGEKAGPKSVCFMISGDGDSTEMQELARAARARGGTTLALVADKTDVLAESVDGAFAICRAERPGSVSLGVRRQAVAGLLALMTARALQRPVPRFVALEKEFAQLPQHIEKAFTQHGAGVRSLAARLAAAKELVIVGAGGYWCSADHSAKLLSRLAGIGSIPVRVSEDAAQSLPAFKSDSLILLLTGSRCELKKRVLATMKAAKRAGAELVALTDGNDRDLMRLPSMALLLPALDEITGSILCHAIMAWTAYEASRLSLMGRRASK